MQRSAPLVALPHTVLTHTDLGIAFLGRALGSAGLDAVAGTEPCSQQKIASLFCHPPSLLHPCLPEAAGYPWLRMKAVPLPALFAGHHGQRWRHPSTKACDGQATHVLLPAPVFATTSALAIQAAGTPGTTKDLAGVPRDPQPSSAASRLDKALQGQSGRSTAHEGPPTQRAACPERQGQSIACAGQGTGKEGLRAELLGYHCLPLHSLKGEKHPCLAALQAQPTQQLSEVSGELPAGLLHSHFPSGHSDTRRRTLQHFMLLSTRLLRWGQRCFSCYVLDLLRVSRACHRCHPLPSHEGGQCLPVHPPPLPLLHNHAQPTPVVPNSRRGITSPLTQWPWLPLSLQLLWDSLQFQALEEVLGRQKGKDTLRVAT